MKLNEFQELFGNLGHRFIVGGDFNAKHSWWSSRLINHKGRELYRCINMNNYSVLSTGNPTYWPSDPSKIPDLLDFVVYSGIPSHLLQINDSDDLNSDHTPIILEYNTFLHCHAKKYRIIDNNTDLNSFNTWIDRNINLNVRIESVIELDDEVEIFNNLIHEAGFLSTPCNETTMVQRQLYVTTEIRRMIQKKRRLRRVWQPSRNPNDERNLNKATKDLKSRLLQLKNDSLEKFVKHLNVTENDEYSLWNATKYLKRPVKRNVPIRNENGSWCRSDKSKAEEFALHLRKTFQPNDIDNNNYTEEIQNFLNSSCPMDWPIKHIKPEEVREEVAKLNSKKSPDYDCITGRIVQNLSKK